MSLKPVGESSVTLKLNGDPVDSYTQSDDSTYDVQASASNQNTETISITWDSFNVSRSYETASFTVPASLDGYTGSVSTNGDFFGNVTTNSDASFSGTFNEGDTFTAEYEGTGDDTVGIAHLTVNIDIPVDPQVSATGSTKS
jgi:hypothetical protein